MVSQISRRVNSARLPDFIGQTVRLACKIIRVSGDTATVQASDGGEVIVHLLKGANLEDTYAEIIGNVVDATSIKMLACINMGNDIDMKLVNDVIELTHDPRLARMFTE